MPKWTNEQQLAIGHEGENIIVSAGAGSGKTAVLSERVLRKLKSGVGIKQLLILTFTKAAAAEMRERIRANIKKNPDLASQLLELDGAYITTFDSYSLSLVKKYHYLLNVSKNIQIGEASVFTIRENEFLDEILMRRYENPTSDFTKLIYDFCTKDDDSLKKSILKINHALDLRYDKVEYLTSYIDTFYQPDTIESYCHLYVSKLFSLQEEMQNIIESLCPLLEEKVSEKVYSFYRKFLDSKTYDEMVGSLDERAPQTPRNSEDDVKAYFAKLSELRKRAKDYLMYPSYQEMKDAILATEGYAKEIVSILLELDQKMMELKHEEDTYDFTDISKMAIQLLLDHPDIKEEVKQSFQEIMIDEYQDTSDLQETFISLIANHNVYMVGDIKQSIYRFRNANPYIFKEKYENYQKGIDGFKIDLNKNFRSRKEVLDNVNLMFDLLMDSVVGGADYKASHRMVFGNTSYEEQGKSDTSHQMEVYRYDYDKSSEYSKEEIEAFWIAQDIKKKIESGYLVYNFKEENAKPRPCKYQDFVIMLDRSTNFGLYKKIFTYFGIPLAVKKDESIKSTTDLLLFSNILTFIFKIYHHEYDTMYYHTYASIARSFLFSLSDQEIFQTITGKRITESSIYQLAEPIAKELDGLSTTELLDRILTAFSYYEKLLCVGDIDSALARIDNLKRIAKGFESIGMTPSMFQEYLVELTENDQLDLKYKVSEDASNAVQIMTIHASKGLEFPICYFASLDVKFNMRDMNDRFLYDNKTGIITPYFKEGIGDTILKSLYKERYTMEEVSEKIRLFYVAVTRAKEKMIFVLPSREWDKGTDYDSKVSWSSLADMLDSIRDVLSPYTLSIDLKEIPLTHAYHTLTKKEYPTSFSHYVEEEISIPVKPIGQERFSKTTSHILSKQELRAMKFGEHMHEVFESIDILHPNLEKLSKFEKEKVTLFLKHDIVRNAPQAVYQEYEFMTELDGKMQHGIIDLLLQYENRYVIIDYKLKEVTDEAYRKQLDGYKKYIYQKTGKSVEAYLYSILDDRMVAM
ncbi:MAG: UvrD-helicase domain-containing protein [Candidatus Faecenecus gallistercoris]|nr:UvrD-helicase domain-containing protein [Bacillota bacterium]MDY4051472.1 UvrD-helicase domain-containing protein [Candidatus Faecenecus gallistercoris]